MSNRPEILALDALATVAAIYGILRFWFKGSIFETLRQFAKLMRDVGSSQLVCTVGAILSCSLCMSFWVTLFFGLVFLLPLAYYPDTTILRVILYILAVMGLLKVEDFYDDGSDEPFRGDTSFEGQSTDKAGNGSNHEGHDGAGQAPLGPPGWTRSSDTCPNLSEQQTEERALCCGHRSNSAAPAR